MGNEGLYRWNYISESGWALNPMTGVLREERETTDSEGLVTMEAVMCERASPESRQNRVLGQSLPRAS